MLSFVILFVFFAAAAAVETNCTLYDTNCRECTKRGACMWCASPTTPFCFATNDTHASAQCDDATCGGADDANDGACFGVCECTSPTFPCAPGLVGQIFLTLVYAALLGFGAKLISDGSEILLELFPSWGTVIGSTLLPILGAIPDSAIIIFSGFGPQAQEQLSVGVGTLAGSTILLLTGAWAGSGVAGRVDFDALGEAQDGVCSPLTLVSMATSGVGVDESTPMNARLMLVTATAYLAVQGVAFAHLSDPTGASAKAAERPAALVGMILCCVLLVAYCAYQLMVPSLAQKRVQRRLAAAAEKGKRLRALHIMQRFPMLAEQGAGTEAEREEAAFHAIAARWKRKALRAAEARARANQVARVKDSATVQSSINAAPSTVSKRRSGRANTGESAPLLAVHDEMGGLIEEEAGGGARLPPHAVVDDDDGDDDDGGGGSHGGGESFCHMLGKSLGLLSLGLALVTVFSDPIVDVISDIGRKINVPAFYLSFVITPFCSNASELVSSLIFASKKKVENTSLTYSQIYGAASMNNTMALGIFFALVYFQRLSWYFNAEVLAILVVTLIVGLVGAFKRSFNMWYSVAISTLYPLSILLVWLLKTPSVGIMIDGRSSP